jgi:hypothetical protein
MKNSAETETTIAKVLQEIPYKINFVEVGVFRAQTLIYIAENCSNVNEVYGVDSYKTYVDYLGPPYSVSQAFADMNKEIVLNKTNQSSQKHKIKLLIEDQKSAADSFEDASIDSIFLDAYMSKEDVLLHYKTWYPKIKKTGLILGHDLMSLKVQEALQALQIRYEVLHDNIWKFVKP